MCWWLFKKKERLDSLYPNELPSLNLDKVIKELEFDIEIHKAYAGFVVQNPSKYPPQTYGDYEWQIRWIEVYKAAIFYLRSSR